MTEFPGPGASAPSIEQSACPASAVADAEAVQLRKVIHLTFPAKQTPQEPPPAVAQLQFATGNRPRGIADVHEGAQTRIAELVREMCGMKNVPIAPEHLDAFASDILQAMPFTQLYQLSGFEQEGVIAAVQAVNAKLDEVFMARVLRLVGELRGADVTDPAVALIATDIFTAFEARQSDPRCMRWPDPADLVRDDCASHHAVPPETCDA